MEIQIDTIDLKEIKDASDHLLISGVTSNPSIVKKTAPSDFYAHMREIRTIIGNKCFLHIQVLAVDSANQLKEAKEIYKNVDDQVVIKVPVTWEGLKTIKALKALGKKVTATCVYDIMQAYAALVAGADYIAPYVNRIASMGGNPYELISHIEHVIARDGYDCKILAASFHSVQQVVDSINAGAQAITVPVEILKATYQNANIGKAIADFGRDWESVFGKGITLANLNESTMRK